MSYDLEIAEGAEHSLKLITVQKRESFGDVIARKRILTLLNGINNLASFPRMGKNARKQGFPIASKFYLMTIGKNIVLYEIQEKSARVVVLRIFSSSQNIAERIMNLDL